jgi:hypothetical protein
MPTGKHDNVVLEIHRASLLNGRALQEYPHIMGSSIKKFSSI